MPHGKAAQKPFFLPLFDQQKTTVDLRHAQNGIRRRQVNGISDSAVL
jgi:hypothetical protein